MADSPSRIPGWLDAYRGGRAPSLMGKASRALETRQARSLPPSGIYMDRGWAVTSHEVHEVMSFDAKCPKAFWSGTALCSTCGPICPTCGRPAMLAALSTKIIGWGHRA